MAEDADTEIAAAYDARAIEYVDALGAMDQMDARDIALISGWRDSTSGLLVDAGCGPGHWTAHLASAGREARGVDLSAELIAAARRRHPSVPFDVGSFVDLPFATGSAGGILAWYSLIHTPPADVLDALGEFARVLAPGGSILLGFFDGEPSERFAHAVAPAWFWSVDALTDLCADAGLEVVSSQTRSRVPGEVSARPHASIIVRSR
nr:class I SAM-dependent methyltransferase [uncultured Microbacterium sp.]